MKLLKILIEQYTKEQFYIENNIDPEELSYLGKGDFGTAYSIGDGRVLKITRSENEFKLAKELEGNTSPVLDSIAKVYKTAIVDGSMYIILEEVDIDSSIEDLFSDMDYHLSNQGLPVQYIDNLDFEEEDISPELKEFMDDVSSIVRAYRYLGVEASDIRPENMGYRQSDNKLVAFDIDDRRR